VTKEVHVQPHILDSVLRDPERPVTYIPNDLIQNAPLSLGAVGLLSELLAAAGDWSIEDARAAELERRATGLPPEDIDELLAELDAAGYVRIVDVP